MKRILFAGLIVSAIFVTGCQKSALPEDGAHDPQPAVNNQNNPANGQANNQLSGAGGGSGSGGIAPMASPSAGGMTPVAGSDSVTGASGGGVQQAAKDQAKRVGAGSSSIDQMPKDEGQ